jgi:hypothetical protein
LSATNDHEPVEAVASDRADPAFGERVRLRRSEWSADDFDAVTLEDVVEGAAEFPVAVVDQEAQRCRSLAERPGELAGLPDSPALIRIRRAAGEVYAAAAEFDEEEYVEPSKQERLDGEEIAGDHRGGVRAHKLAPTELDARTCVRHARLSEDLGDRGRRDAHTDRELTNDPLVARGVHKLGQVQIHPDLQEDRMRTDRFRHSAQRFSQFVVKSNSGGGNDQSPTDHSASVGKQTAAPRSNRERPTPQDGQVKSFQTLGVDESVDCGDLSGVVLLGLRARTIADEACS